MVRKLNVVGDTQADLAGTPITTGIVFSDVKTSSSASSEKTSLLSNLLITRMKSPRLPDL
jgi:hypothetical protein